MVRNSWTREQLIEVLKLYCRTPFGRLHSRNPEIVALAAQIGRTPGAVALKAVNFASLDPTIDRKGMANASALDREVWTEFFANLDQYIDAPKEEVPNKGFDEAAQEAYIASLPEGLDIPRLSKVRMNQGFFREMVLASYDGRCAITGISEPELLTASHIMPWSEVPSARTNPRNGICLNALHDRAFDRGFITFGESLNVIYSPRLSNDDRVRIQSLGGDRLNLPSRFLPDREFLDYHRSKKFKTS
jgi:putative restriction endonuclease